MEISRIHLRDELTDMQSGFPDVSFLVSLLSRSVHFQFCFGCDTLGGAASVFFFEWA